MMAPSDCAVVSVLVWPSAGWPFLPEAVRSVLDQTGDHVLGEVVVIDDGRDPAVTREVRRCDGPVRVVEIGPGDRRAAGTAIAALRGEVIALLEPTHVWRPGKLAAQLEALSDPEVSLVHCDLSVLAEDGTLLLGSLHEHCGRPLLDGDGLSELLRDPVIAPTLAVRRQVLDQALPLPEVLPSPAWWLAVSAAAVGQVRGLSEPMAATRWLGGELTLDGGTGDLDRRRAEHRFRRALLRSLPLERLPIVALRAAWEHYIEQVIAVAGDAGHGLADEVQVPSGDQHESAQLTIAAEEALQAGRLKEAARSALSAVATDPFSRSARALFQRVLAASAPPDEEEDPAPEPPDSPSDALAWAEARFEDGKLDGVVETLLAVAAGAADPALASRAHADIAVIAASAGKEAVARTNALESLRHDPGQIGALEALAHLAERDRDDVAGEHWLRRAIEANPEDPASRIALARLQLARGRWAEAVDSFDAAAALATLPGGAAASRALAERRRAAQDATARAPAKRPKGRRRALVCVDFYWPHLGGTERIAEGIGVQLLRRGWHVEIACRALGDRTARTWRGMPINEIERDPVSELREIVRARRIDGIFTFADPFAWPFAATLQLPPGPRVVMLPCITANVDGLLRADLGNRAAYRRLLHRAQVVAQCSANGYDARLHRELELETVVLSNAAEAPTPRGSVRAMAGIPDGKPLLLHVSNVLPHKNLPALLETLAADTGDWRLVSIGDTRHADAGLLRQVERLVSADPRVFFLGPQPPEVVAGGLCEADAFLLPSLSDTSPVVVAEAMSRGVPWVATPYCTLEDHAGGLIARVDDFGLAVEFLLADAEARRALGEAGRRHWEEAMSYPVVGARVDALLRGADLLAPVCAPPGARDVTDRLRAAFLDGLVDAEPERSGAFA
jgi:glycosyltransferase involved in cell wall biosynthesis